MFSDYCRMSEWVSDLGHLSFHMQKSCMGITGGSLKSGDHGAKAVAWHAQSSGSGPRQHEKTRTFSVEPVPAFSFDLKTLQPLLNSPQLKFQVIQTHDLAWFQEIIDRWSEQLLLGIAAKDIVFLLSDHRHQPARLCSEIHSSVPSVTLTPLQWLVSFGKVIHHCDQ